MICRSGLSLEQITILLDTATVKEKYALLAESFLLKGEYWFAIPQAEAYLADVDLSKANPLDKKVSKLLMHAYHRSMFGFRNKARPHAENVIRFIDDNNYEANLVYAEICLDDGRPEEAIERANKFLTLRRDDETKHFRYYDSVKPESKKEYPPQDWYFIRAKHVLAASYKDLGDIEQAQLHAEDAIRKYSELSCVPSEPLNIMAWVYSQQGNHAEALNCVQTSWDSYNSESIRIAIESYLGIGNIGRAVEWGEYCLAQKEFKNNKEISLALLSAYQKDAFSYGYKAKQLVANMASSASASGLSFFDANAAGSVEAGCQAERPQFVRH